MMDVGRDSVLFFFYDCTVLPKFQKKRVPLSGRAPEHIKIEVNERLSEMMKTYQNKLRCKIYFIKLLHVSL